MEKLEPYEVSTLYNVVISPNRRSGNTTRQIDKAVQILFAGDICIVQDHFKFGTDVPSNQLLAKKIMKRFKSEFLDCGLTFDFNRQTNIISLKLEYGTV